GTALDGVVARRLQDGDADGHIRRALAHFPSQAIAERVLATYFREGGRPAGKAYRPHPTLTIDPSQAAIELSLVGNFAEVWLAKEGHDGVVGINFLEKIQTATLSAVLGAMLAGVDYVLMGAGIPKEMPRVLTEFAAGRPASLTIEVENQTEVHKAVLDPRAYLGDDLPEMTRPHFVAIISLHVLGAYLAR
ncbi:MAG TPA: 2-nitropropane dioxygenase, partial [Propionibacteriaceae bacterium]|nr:2-nitropropane dioxygenase [Propionibacteriaceae bacterium]